jgi:hypothetical protein
MVKRALLAAALLLSCGPPQKPQYLVDDLRILAIRDEVLVDPSDAADAEGGDTIRLTALVGNPQNLPLRLRWITCLPQPGVAVPPCADTRSLADPEKLIGKPGVLDLGEGEQIDLTIPVLVQPLLLALIARGEQHPEYACSTYIDLPVVLIASGGGQKQSAVKSVRLSPYRELAKQSLPPKYVRNRNPEIREVRMDPKNVIQCAGGAQLNRYCTDATSCAGLECLDHVCQTAIPLGRERELCARLLEGSVQIFHECDADGSTRDYYEGVSWQWYTTAGTLTSKSAGTTLVDNGDLRGGDVIFTPPASGHWRMWLIARDGRGGLTWFQRDY